MAFMPEEEVAKYLDEKFGKGKWKLTGGYRTRQREDELRAQGAETVKPGATSAHSRGTLEAPGAEDIVVEGKTPDEVKDALKDGPFARVFPEGRHGSQGGHVHLDALPALPSGWSLAPPGGGGDVAPPPPKGWTIAPPEQPGDKPHGTVTEAEMQKLASAGRKTPLQRAGESFAQVGADVGHGQLEAGRQFNRDLGRGFTRPGDALPIPDPGLFVTDALDVLGGGAIGGLTTGAVGRPTVNTLRALNKGQDPSFQLGQSTYVPDPQGIGNLAAVAAGGLGEAGEVNALRTAAQRSGVSREALAANREAAAALPRPASTEVRPPEQDTAHQAAVRRLRDAGVRPAAHQAAGGAVQRFTEAAKSDFHVGTGIRSTERDAAESFNRALYNKALAPLGERVPDTTPVGRDGVKMLQQRFDTAYKEAQPHIHIPDDATLTSDLADIRSSVAKLGKPQEQQFEAILNQDVLHHFQAGGLDGESYQSVKSDLLRQARELRGSSDPNARGLGRALDETVGALSEAATRGSDPKWRARIGDIDKGYAVLTRIEDAAARRLGGKGDITPMDLLAAVKKGDTRIRKRGFGAGDALLQQFAEDADTVLSPKVRDSGTAERSIASAAMGLGHAAGGAAISNAMGLGPLPGVAVDAAIAPVTNALARRVLTGATRRPVNYLRAAQQRALASRAPIVAGTAGQLTGPQQ